jgi:hypothetical protein
VGDTVISEHEGPSAAEPQARRDGDVYRERRKAETRRAQSGRNEPAFGEMVLNTKGAEGAKRFGGSNFPSGKKWRALRKFFLGQYCEGCNSGEVQAHGGNSNENTLFPARCCEIFGFRSLV